MTDGQWNFSNFNMTKSYNNSATTTACLKSMGTCNYI